MLSPLFYVQLAAFLSDKAKNVLHIFMNSPFSFIFFYLDYSIILLILGFIIKILELDLVVKFTSQENYLIFKWYKHISCSLNVKFTLKI